MRILLVRHGESLGNVDPLSHATTTDHAVPLSDRGREQAREAGARVAAHLAAQIPGERPHVRLWVSPYQRTRQTADAVMETARGWITDRVEHILLCEQQFGMFDGVPEEALPVRSPASSRTTTCSAGSAASSGRGCRRARADSTWPSGSTRRSARSTATRSSTASTTSSWSLASAARAR